MQHSQTIIEAQNHYLQYLYGIRGSSTATLQAVKNDLEKLTKYLATLGVIELQHVETHHVQSWLNSGRRSGLQPATLRRRLASIRGFTKHLMALNLLVKDVAESIDVPKVASPLPTGFSELELCRALETFKPSGKRKQDWFAVRDYAMIELFYSAGLRLAELVGVDVDCLDVHSGTIRVLGKGAKERMTIVGDAAMTALTEWMLIRDTTSSGREKAVFVSQQGRRLSARSVQLRVARFAEHAGLPRHMHPHQLRHSFATHMLKRSKNIRAVQSMLGHANISSTQMYTHLDTDYLSESWRHAHPRAQKLTRNSARNSARQPSTKTKQQQ